MESIFITVKNDENNEAYDFEVPVNITSEAFLKQLTDYLSLKNNYSSFRVQGKKRVIAQNEFLVDAGVKDGDILIMF